MKRFLVTGGAGFIGSHCVEHLLKTDHSVVILDNFCNSSKDNLDFLKHYNPDTYKIIEGDIRDKQCCLEATQNIDFIFLHIYYFKNLDKLGLKYLGPFITFPSTL